MKRTATTLALMAGFAGGCMSPEKQKVQQEPPTSGSFNRVSHSQPIPGVVGPTGEPVAFGARGATPGDVPGTAKVGGGTGVEPVGHFFHKKDEGCSDCAHVPSLHKYGGQKHQFGQNGAMYNTGAPNPPGILPVPGMGPPGAVAAVGAINPMMMQQPSNQRSSVKFVGPAGMRIGWQLPGGQFTDEANALTAPAAYNFLQSQVYRLRLSSLLPNYPGKVFYPTLEIVAANPKTLRFLAHTTVPIGFTNEDFDQALAGNMVVKVIYLPDREFADFATVAGAEEIVSTRLDPGADPIAEAQRRGSILAIVTLGNIDLENRFSPQMNQPSTYGPAIAPPGALPGPAPGPGLMPGPGPMPTPTPTPTMTGPAPSPGTFPVPGAVPGSLPAPGSFPKPTPGVTTSVVPGSAKIGGSTAQPPLARPVVK